MTGSQIAEIGSSLIGAHTVRLPCTGPLGELYAPTVGAVGTDESVSFSVRTSRLMDSSSALTLLCSYRFAVLDAISAQVGWFRRGKVIFERVGSAWTFTLVGRQ